MINILSSGDDFVSPKAPPKAAKATKVTVEPKKGKAVKRPPLRITNPAMEAELAEGVASTARRVDEESEGSESDPIECTQPTHGAKRRLPLRVPQ